MDYILNKSTMALIAIVFQSTWKIWNGKINNTLESILPENVKTNIIANTITMESVKIKNTNEKELLKLNKKSFFFKQY